jgi:hypothetical protein
VLPARNQLQRLHPKDTDKFDFSSLFTWLDRDLMWPLGGSVMGSASGESDGLLAAADQIGIGLQAYNHPIGVNHTIKMNI